MNFRKIDYKKYVSWICLFTIVLLISILSSRFRTFENAKTILRQVSINGILAVGLSFVMISGGIDLSVGPLIGLTATLAGMLMVDYGVPVFPSCLIAIAVATLFGLFNGVSITITKMPPLISTLGMSYVVQGCAYLIHGGLPVRGLPESMQFIGQGYLGPIPVPIVIFVVIAIAGSFILNKTTYGRSIYAMGSNYEASRLAGINVRKIQITVYTVAGLLAGLGGVIMLSRMNAGQPGTGKDTSLDIVVGCILGGVSATGGEGSIIGLIGGVLMIGVLSNGMTILGLNEYYQLLMKGAVLVAAVGFDYYARTKRAEKKSHIIHSSEKEAVKTQQK